MQLRQGSDTYPIRRPPPFPPPFSSNFFLRSFLPIFSQPIFPRTFPHPQPPRSKFTLLFWGVFPLPFPCNMSFPAKKALPPLQLSPVPRVRRLKMDPPPHATFPPPPVEPAPPPQADSLFPAGDPVARGLLPFWPAFSPNMASVYSKPL